MKYWNKDRDIRRRCWTQVVRPKNLYHIGDTELKRWYQQQSSTGKFYVYYGTDTWWFERPEDATLFALRWS
jgi:hypothetical protein